MEIEEQLTDLELRAIKKTSESENSNSSRQTVWRMFGQELPREEIVFFCQMIIIIIVVSASVYNLSFSKEDTTLWTALLSSSLGYALPNPSLNRVTKKK